MSAEAVCGASAETASCQKAATYPRGLPRKAARSGGLFERRAAGRVGLFIKAVLPKRPSVRSDGLSERLCCPGVKIALLGCEDCAARVCVEMLTAMVCCTGRAGRGEPGLANRLQCCGPAGVGLWGVDMVGRVHASWARCGCLRRLP